MQIKYENYKKLYKIQYSSVLYFQQQLAINMKINIGQLFKILKYVSNKISKPLVFLRVLRNIHILNNSTL